MIFFHSLISFGLFSSPAIRRAHAWGTTAFTSAPSGTFAFANALIPTTLVEGARTLERRRLHRRAAAAIESRHPDDFEALAHHYRRAGKDHEAATYLLQAGDRARGLYAHQEAIDSYQQALEILKQTGDPELVARTLMKLGLTYHNAFDFGAAREAFRRALPSGSGSEMRSTELPTSLRPPPTR